MSVVPLIDPQEPSPLASARLQRKLTVDEAARRAGLTPDQIEWLEAGRVYRFPAADDALVAVVLYATAIGIDQDEARGLARLPVERRRLHLLHPCGREQDRRPRLQDRACREGEPLRLPRHGRLLRAGWRGVWNPSCPPTRGPSEAPARREQSAPPRRHCRATPGRLNPGGFGEIESVSPGRAARQRLRPGFAVA